MAKVSPAVRQEMSTRPISVDSAPYFPALVASSCSASPIACAAVAFKRNFGPCTVIRDPTRSARYASWARLLGHFEIGKRTKVDVPLRGPLKCSDRAIVALFDCANLATANRDEVDRPQRIIVIKPQVDF